MGEEGKIFNMTKIRQSFTLQIDGKNMGIEVGTQSGSRYILYTSSGGS